MSRNHEDPLSVPVTATGDPPAMEDGGSDARAKLAG
jgi:hypothetical protein